MIKSMYIVPGAPRLALLSDLHGRPYQEAVRLVQDSRPEMICITGDLITGILPEDEVSPLVSQPYVLPFLEKCAEIAPAFVSLGNHEQVLDETDLRKIEQTGVTVLDNRWVRKDKWIVGGLTSACVTDYRKAKPQDSPLRYPKVPRVQRSGIPKTDWLDGFIRQEGFHILLSHHISWGTPTLNGKGLAYYDDDTGKAKFRRQKVFTTLASAKTWLNSKANISA